MAEDAGISDELRDLAGLAPAGYFIALHIRFASPLVNRVTYGSSWQAHYNAQAYQLRDPIIAWGLSREGAARWSEIDIPDPFDVLGQAAEHGLCHGLCVSHGPIRSRSIIAAARSDRPYDAAEIAAAHILARRMHDVTEPRETLTPAQAEALRRIAAGDRHAAAAANLGISESAFKARLTSARQRLGCRTTAETIQKAREQGLL